MSQTLEYNALSPGHTVHENILALSTASVQYDDAPRQYLSAAHAVSWYFLLKCRIEGAPALDYGRMLGVQTQPGRENPHLVCVDEIHAIEAAFLSTWKRVGLKSWRVWCEVRIAGSAVRDVEKISKSAVSSITRRVDGVFEEELHELGRLAPSQIRPRFMR